MSIPFVKFTLMPGIRPIYIRVDTITQVYLKQSGVTEILVVNGTQPEEFSISETPEVAMQQIMNAYSPPIKEAKNADDICQPSLDSLLPFGINLV